MLKSDHFLADANWEMVEKTTEIDNPYKHLTESVPVSVCVCVCVSECMCVCVCVCVCVCMCV